MLLLKSVHVPHSTPYMKNTASSVYWVYFAKRFFLVYFAKASIVYWVYFAKHRTVDQSP